MSSGGLQTCTRKCCTSRFPSSCVLDLRTKFSSRKYVIQKGPEARLCLALVAAVLPPTGMLIYAWTARPSIHWIAPLIGLTVSLLSCDFYGRVIRASSVHLRRQVFMVGTFIIYQVVFVYLADWYVATHSLPDTSVDPFFVSVKLRSICVICVGRAKHVSYVPTDMCHDSSDVFDFVLGLIWYQGTFLERPFRCLRNACTRTLRTSGPTRSLRSYRWR